jgi:hypothetical protein
VLRDGRCVVKHKAFVTREGVQYVREDGDEARLARPGEKLASAVEEVHARRLPYGRQQHPWLDAYARSPAAWGSVGCVVSSDEYLDVLDELREASMAYEDAYDDCPRDGRATSAEFRSAADRLRDVGTRYAAERDRRSETLTS